ncbi:GGDEF domain-containing protein [Thiospirochaeta perfilievii]|uniref:GGDEF domain-containing protein n=1 Tax=Thiospirochaeta perfilievii TaxID=252967 RepID=A0A5C1QHF0_9SPIO|nr:GGDEF domain-containing protein [Thiospirochaeta perfilievii]QEN05974.1 GGDEF domain-containing protein [Thiospirochaeta perfilievii]
MINVGIIITNLYDHYQQTLLRGIEYYCKDKNIRFFAFVDMGITDTPLSSIIYKSNLDVVVLLSPSLASLYGYENLSSFVDSLPDIPIISVGLTLPGCYNILVDNRMGVFNLMNHLIVDHGKKRVAFIKGPDTNREAFERFEAYKESLNHNNIPFNYKLISPGNFTPGDGRKGLSLIMDIRKESFDAVFCCHDLSAYEVIQSLQSRGYKVPEDVVVVGFDNFDLSSSFSPALSTVKQPVYNIGLIVGEYIDGITRGKNISKDLLIDTQIVLRESCGCIRSINSDLKFKKPEKERSIEELVQKAQGIILESNKFKYEVGEYNKKLQKSISFFSAKLLESIKNRDSIILLKEIKELQMGTSSMDLDLPFWKYVLEEYNLVILEGLLDSELQLYISSILNMALIILYENERKLVDVQNVDNRSIIQYTNEIGDLLLTCKNDEELKKILKNGLSTVRIDNCFIVLFTNKEDVGELYFSRNMENLFENDSYEFNLRSIIPNNLGKASLKSYIFCGLQVNKSYVGYILIENGDYPNMMYSFISKKVSYGFKNISLIKKMNSYAMELEEAVKERTAELEMANKRLQERSVRDQLTGLYNRRFLNESIISINDVGLYGVVLIDLDHFKLVNDVYGHTSGDNVIKELAKSLTYVVRPEDYVIRLGGEEFLLVLRNFKREFIKKFVNKVRDAVKETKFIMENGDEIYKTCSLGAMVYNPVENNVLNFTSAISIIDKCLYISKEKGRDRGVIIDVYINQFTGCSDIGEYITKNFQKCIETQKIKLIESN